MGVLLPIVLFLLLGLSTFSQFLTIAASTLFTWGIADMLTSLLSRPRLKDRSPRALKEDWERRSKE